MRPNLSSGLMMVMHPLGEIITRAADGDFPEVDGAWERVEPWRAGVEGVVAFTGHAYVAVGDAVADTEVDRLGADGYGGAHNPRLALGLSGGGFVDCLDLVLAARGTGANSEGEGPLVPRNDLRNHPRAELATLLRSEVRTYGYAAHDDRTVVTFSRGLGGLAELGVEADDRHAGSGTGLVRDALDLVPADEVVVAACAPGNARAIRAFLGAGFAPVASVQLWRPGRARGF